MSCWPLSNRMLKKSRQRRSRFAQRLNVPKRTPFFASLLATALLEKILSILRLFGHHHHMENPNGIIVYTPSFPATC